MIFSLALIRNDNPVLCATSASAGDRRSPLRFFAPFALSAMNFLSLFLNFLVTFVFSVVNLLPRH